MRDDTEPSVFGTSDDPAIDMLNEHLDGLESLGDADAIESLREGDTPAALEDALLHYLDHPVEWIEDILNMRLDDWQAAVVNALAKDRFVSVRAGRGVGKSAIEAAIVLWFLCTHPFCKIIVTAPTREQLFDVLWAECYKWIRQSAKLQQIVSWTEGKIYVKSNPAEWFAVARTAEVRKLGKTGLVAAEGLQGRHAESMLVVMDEASGIDEAIMATVDGVLTSPESYLLMASNPTRPVGTFFDSFHSQRKLWRTFHVNAEENHRVDRHAIDRMLDLYGSRDHPLYMIYVRGEFPPASHNSLFPLALVEESIGLELQPSPYDPCELGVDVARYGGDLTAIAVKHGPVVLQIDTYQQLSTMETCGRVIQYINKFRPVAVKIDVVGVGAGVYDRLHELQYKECIPVAGSSSPQTPEGEKQFINLRAEAHWHVRTLLEQKRLRLPPDDAMVGQMTSITYKHSSRGKLQVESKEDLRDRGAKSPDRLDALVLACMPIHVAIQRSGARFGTISFMGR